MERKASRHLDAWLRDPSRKPLVLRGTRQVGKTWLVRDLAQRAGRDLVELNLERDPLLRRHFATNDPRRILGELSLALDRDIHAERSILFLDEIQDAVDLLAKLRWFHEELPALPVLAAGSLLEFALADPMFSMPVGRISFLHVEPLSFSEYLAAHGQARLLATLSAWRPGHDFSPAAHERAMAWFERYAMVGGMPAVVAEEISGREPRKLRGLQRELIAAFRADFASYRGRVDREVLDSVLLAVAGSLGRKFVYSHVGEGIKQNQAKRGLELLAMARLIHIVRHSAANGLPLGAEVKETFRKAVLADVGLAHALLSTPANQAFPHWASLAPAVRGQLTEQLAAQTLRILDDATMESPELYYWQREGGRPGEIDYLVQLHGRIVPFELKSGAAGSMKSLHQFMFEKKLELAVRCDAHPPSVQDLDFKTTRGDRVRYRLVNVPLYLLWNLAEVLGTAAEA